MQESLNSLTEINEDMLKMNEDLLRMKITLEDQVKII